MEDTSYVGIQGSPKHIRWEEKEMKSLHVDYEQEMGKQSAAFCALVCI